LTDTRHQTTDPGSLVTRSKINAPKATKYSQHAEVLRKNLVRRKEEGILHKE
jgi:hypothetical protein